MPSARNNVHGSRTLFRPPVVQQTRAPRRPVPSPASASLATTYEPVQRDGEDIFWFSYDNQGYEAYLVSFSSQRMFVRTYTPEELYCDYSYAKPYGKVLLNIHAEEPLAPAVGVSEEDVRLFLDESPF